MELFGILMLIDYILGLKKVLRVWLFVDENGIWVEFRMLWDSLDFIWGVCKNWENYFFVWEDWKYLIFGGLVVWLWVLLGSYVKIGELLKVYKMGNFF